VGEPVIFNFQLSSPPVVQPFQSFTLHEGIVQSTVIDDETDGGTIRVFSGLNGTGTSWFVADWQDSGYPLSLSGTSVCNPPPAFQPAYCSLSFSLLYSASAGSIEAFPTFRIKDGAGEEYVIEGQAVPVPTSLALLGLGALVLFAAPRAWRRA
jgi:hypothetical protein